MILLLARAALTPAACTETHSHLLKHKEVFCGGGSLFHLVKISTDLLFRLTDARVQHITDAPALDLGGGGRGGGGGERGGNKTAGVDERKKGASGGRGRSGQRAEDREAVSKAGEGQEGRVSDVLSPDYVSQPK